MRRAKQPKILTLAILTTFTVLTWVAFEVWRSFSKPQPVQIDASILRPLDPNLDTSTISKLKGNTYLPDSDARRGASSPIVATPLPSPEGEASPTPAGQEPSASPAATTAPTSAPAPNPTGDSTQ